MSTLLLLLATAHAHPVDGRWVLEPSMDEVEVLQGEAVEKALRSWPAFAVAKARAAVVEDNAPCAHVTFATDGELAYGCADLWTYRRPLEGEDQVEDDDGKPVTTQVDLDATDLEIQWVSGQGRRIDRYRVEGDHLVVEHTIRSPFLPRAIQWALRYRPAAVTEASSAAPPEGT